MTPLYCVHSFFVPCFPFELVDKVFGSMALEAPRWSARAAVDEVRLEDEDLGEGGEGVVFASETFCVILFLSVDLRILYFGSSHIA